MLLQFSQRPQPCRKDGQQSLMSHKRTPDLTRVPWGVLKKQPFWREICLLVIGHVNQASIIRPSVGCLWFAESSKKHWHPVICNPSSHIASYKRPIHNRKPIPFAARCHGNLKMLAMSLQRHLLLLVEKKAQLDVQSSHNRCPVFLEWKRKKAKKKKKKKKNILPLVNRWKTFLLKFPVSSWWKANLCGFVHNVKQI